MPKKKGAIIDNIIFTQSNFNSQTEITKKELPHESGEFTKRIGSTNYRVSVHFSQTSRETMDDKIIRLIRNETADRKAAGE